MPSLPTRGANRETSPKAVGVGALTSSVAPPARVSVPAAVVSEIWAVFSLSIGLP